MFLAAGDNEEVEATGCLRVFEDVVSFALISSCAFVVHVPVHLADVLRPSWANALESQNFPVTFGSSDIRGFPGKHNIYDMLVVVDGAKCPPELEGQEVDYVWNARDVQFPPRSAEKLGPLKWEGGSKLFSKFLARSVPEVNEADVHNGSDIA